MGKRGVIVISCAVLFEIGIEAMPHPKVILPVPAEDYSNFVCPKFAEFHYGKNGGTPIPPELDADIAQTEKDEVDVADLDTMLPLKQQQDTGRVTIAVSDVPAQLIDALNRDDCPLAPSKESAKVPMNLSADSSSH